MARLPGAKAKIPGAAKENIHAVFIRLGGTAAMAKWARDNQTEFYKIYARLLPVEMTSDGTGPVTIQIIKFGDEEIKPPLEHEDAEIVESQPVKALTSV